MVKSELIFRLLLLSNYLINERVAVNAKKLNLKDMLARMVENFRYQKEGLLHFSASIY